MILFRSDARQKAGPHASARRFNRRIQSPNYSPRIKTRGRSSSVELPLHFHRFTSASWKLSPRDSPNKKTWVNALEQLSKVDASCRNMLTMWGHYWFRLILLLCARIISVWDCTNHCLPPTTGCIGKPSWIRSDQQRTLICANPANDRVCQSGLSWWHLMSRDEKDRSRWMTGCARKNLHFIQSSKELRAREASEI